MDVKEAVGRALKYVTDLFGGEKISNLGLEEVEFDESRKEWIVTVGFSRPWDYSKSGLRSLTPFDFNETPPRRDYKIVRVGDLRRARTLREESGNPDSLGGSSICDERSSMRT